MIDDVLQNKSSGFETALKLKPKFRSVLELAVGRNVYAAANTSVIQFTLYEQSTEHRHRQRTQNNSLRPAIIHKLLSSEHKIQ